ARLPAAVLKVQRNLGVDSLSKVDAMGVVLGRGQHQLAQANVARVEIERPRFLMPPQGGVLSFPRVGLVLDRADAGRVDGRAEGPERLQQTRAHARLVVIGLLKPKPWTFERDGTEGVC